MKEIIKSVIVENQQFNLPNIVRRKLSIPLDLGIIVSLIGARRSGKTYILYDLIYQLKQRGIEPQYILFINFEDERLNFEPTTLDLILQSYQELYPTINLEEVYFFFDEIQNVNGWQKFVRRLFDTKSSKIFITGSNSRLLSTEIATELRGRTVSYSVYPFSFSEFLSVREAPKDSYTLQNKSQLIQLSQQFILEGSFPEILNFEARIKIKVLQQYFNVMIYRDIVERYKVANPEVLKYFIKKVFAAVGKPFSINKTYNDLKSLGYKISNKYLYDYVNYCNSIFLTQTINKFHFSELKQVKSDKKMYVIDNGLLNAIDFKISNDKGKLLENAVAMEFIKQEKEVFYFKDRYECDFIIKQGNELSPIQVAWTVAAENTKKRELRGLETACEYLKVNQGTVITFDETDTFNYKGIEVKVVPFYRFFGNFSNS